MVILCIIEEFSYATTFQYPFFIQSRKCEVVILSSRNPLTIKIMFIITALGALELHEIFDQKCLKALKPNKKYV